MCVRMYVCMHAWMVMSVRKKCVLIYTCLRAHTLYFQATNPTYIPSNTSERYWRILGRMMRCNVWRTGEEWSARWHFGSTYARHPLIHLHRALLQPVAKYTRSCKSAIIQHCPYLSQSLQPLYPAAELLLFHVRESEALVSWLCMCVHVIECMRVYVDIRDKKTTKTTINKNSS